MQPVETVLPCIWNGHQQPCFLFARKFLPETSEALLELLPSKIWARPLPSAHEEKNDVIAWTRGLDPRELLLLCLLFIGQHCTHFNSFKGHHWLSREHSYQLPFVRLLVLFLPRQFIYGLVTELGMGGCTIWCTVSCKSSKMSNLLKAVFSSSLWMPCSTSSDCSSLSSLVLSWP